MASNYNLDENISFIASLLDINKSIAENDCTCAKNGNDAIKCLTDRVDYVYNFRDRYFDTNPVIEADNKSVEVELLIKGTHKVFDDDHEARCQTTEKNKAWFWYLRGRLMNANVHHNEEALDFLTKANTIYTKAAEIWNELGLAYQKAGDAMKSKFTLDMAVVLDRNKVTLRNLSLMGTTQENYDHAKEAVGLDAADGFSWCRLGIAHISLFLAPPSRLRLLRAAMTSFEHAEKDPRLKYFPEFHYHKGMAQRYEEDFERALKSFKHALMLDSDWDYPKKRYTSTLEYLQQIQELSTSNGKLSARKVRKLVEQIDSRHFGPLLGDNYKDAEGKIVKLTEINFGALQDGLNKEKAIMGKVTCNIRNDLNNPFTFCLIDKELGCVVVTSFNVQSGKGVIIGDSVAIPEPFVISINFEYDKKSYKFRLVQLESPANIIINGRDGSAITVTC